MDGVAECVDVLRGVVSAESDAACRAGAASGAARRRDDGDAGSQQQAMAVLDGLLFTPPHDTPYITPGYSARLTSAMVVWAVG